MVIPFRKEGAPFLAVTALLFVISVLLTADLHGALLWILDAVLLVFLSLFLVFFRDPERQASNVSPKDILSPADGRVLEVREVKGHGGEKAKQINIFLSIFNVHVQRAPVAAKLEFVQHRPGKFLMAFNKDAERYNEQNIIGLKSLKNKRIIVKQITGAIARRILCWKKPGESIRQGERLGMMYFGSQVDLVLPASAKLSVKKGNKVYGGKTIIGRFI